MVPIMSLLVPIVVSAVLVFIVSSIIHMFLGYHANDFEKRRQRVVEITHQRGP